MTFARFSLAVVLVTVSFTAGRLSVGRDVVDAQSVSKPTVVKRITQAPTVCRTSKTSVEGERHSEGDERRSACRRRRFRTGMSDRSAAINLSGSGQLETAEGKVDLPPGRWVSTIHRQRPHEGDQQEERVDLAVRRSEAASAPSTEAGSSNRSVSSKGESRGSTS